MNVTHAHASTVNPFEYVSPWPPPTHFLTAPSPLIDEPYDPYWWVRSKLRAEQLPTNPADGWE